MYLCPDQHSLHSLAPGNCSLLVPCVPFLPLFIFCCVLPRFSACASDSRLSMESICLEEHTVPCWSSRASCISVPGLSERQQLFVGLEASQGLVTQKAEHREKFWDVSKQRPLQKMLRTRDRAVACFSWRIYSTTPPRAPGVLGTRGWKDCKSRRNKKSEMSEKLHP